MQPSKRWDGRPVAVRLGGRSPPGHASYTGALLSMSSGPWKVIARPKLQCRRGTVFRTHGWGRLYQMSSNPYSQPGWLRKRQGEPLPPSASFFVPSAEKPWLSSRPTHRTDASKNSKLVTNIVFFKEHGSNPIHQVLWWVCVWGVRGEVDGRHSPQLWDGLRVSWKGWTQPREVPSRVLCAWVWIRKNWDVRC